MELGVNPYDFFEMTLSLNKTNFRQGDTLILTAQVTPEATPRTVDVYVAVQLPDGTLLFWQGGMNFTSQLHPVVRNWTVAPFSGEIFHYTFNGGEPLGNYTWLGAFTEPGTLTIIEGITQAPFCFNR